MGNKVAFSSHGLAGGAAIDADALSDVARYKIDARRVVLGATEADTAVFTQNETNKHSLGPLGQDGTIVGATISAVVVPAGGTLAVHLVAYDASGNAEIILTDTLNPEGFTAREGVAFVMAATNVALDALDTIELHAVANNATVTTDASQVWVTLVIDPTETNPPTR